ncbi:hypothetical protein [Desulfonatronum thioautotrophicum]|uniref:hypothetical protein n=1 Tax=Desulfonatronum thioautotrophicum TaxID=617001 RepID=UPI0005EB690E|nr:hypothetical protein [Desulfonatronum thioautotrophicum]
MSGTLAGLLAMAYGAVFALFGYPIFRILLPIYGGIVGYILGVTVVAPDYPIAALFIAIILAILFASAAYLYWSVMIGLAGAILGYGLVTVIVGAIWPSATFIPLLVGLTGALVGFYVFIYAKDAMVMVASALNGAMIVAWGFRTMFYPGSMILDSFTIIVFVLMAITGLVVQFKYFGQQQKYSQKPTEPTS